MNRMVYAPDVTRIFVCCVCLLYARTYNDILDDISVACMFSFCSALTNILHVEDFGLF